jgi:hypothetical protein
MLAGFEPPPTSIARVPAWSKGIASALTAAGNTKLLRLWLPISIEERREEGAEVVFWTASFCEDDPSLTSARAAASSAV